MNHLEYLYVDLVERSNWLKGKEAEERYSDLELELRDAELTFIMTIVAQRIALSQNQPTAFSKN